MSKSKKMTVYQVDFKYRAYLKKICMNALTFYRGIPLTWEDIYNNFLYEAPKLLEGYSDGNELSEKTFIGIKCKFFAFNYCKSFQTNKHKIMNDSIEITGDRHVSLSDSVELGPKVDISIFTREELMVYQSHFLDGKSYNQIHDETDISKYKLKALGKILQTKMYSNLKN